MKNGDLTKNLNPMIPIERKNNKILIKLIMMYGQMANGQKLKESLDINVRRRCIEY